ncbi:MAG: cytochrome c1 [Pseudomonadota bacterium]
MKRFALIASLLLASAPVLAGGGHGMALDKAGVDLSDTASLQRGAQLFVDNCLSCHAAKYMRYNRIGQDLGWSVDEVRQRLVKGDAKPGDTMASGMPVAYAKAAFGVLPPDLSLTARSQGADWIYTYLRSFYADPSRPTGANNLLFKDVGMPNVFWREQGEMSKEDDGHGGFKLVQTKPGSMSPEAFDGMIRDLTGFMVYMAEPAVLKRQAVGPWVLGFLLVFFVIVYLLKRDYWRDVK